MKNEPKQKLILPIPREMRSGIERASVIPLWTLVVLGCLIPVYMFVLNSYFVTSSDKEWGSTLPIPILFAIAALSLACCGLLAFLVRIVMAPGPSARLARHVSASLKMSKRFESDLSQRLNRTLWIDAFTKTVPTPYRRIEVDPKCDRTVPYWVMDVGRDFASIKFELYDPGASPTPPLTKTDNPLDGYAYFDEWQRSKR